MRRHRFNESLNYDNSPFKSSDIAKYYLYTVNRDLFLKHMEDLEVAVHTSVLVIAGLLYTQDLLVPVNLEK